MGEGINRKGAEVQRFLPRIKRMRTNEIIGQIVNSYSGAKSEPQNTQRRKGIELPHLTNTTDPFPLTILPLKSMPCQV